MRTTLRPRGAVRGARAGSRPVRHGVGGLGRSALFEVQVAELEQGSAHGFVLDRPAQRQGLVRDRQRLVVAAQSRAADAEARHHGAAARVVLDLRVLVSRPFEQVKGLGEAVGVVVCRAWLSEGLELDHVVAVPFRCCTASCSVVVTSSTPSII